MRRSEAFAALVLVLLIALAEDARASPRRVDVVVAGSSESSEALVAVLTELLARLPVEPHIAIASNVDTREVLTPRRVPDTIAHVWVDLTTPNEARVFVVDGPWERVLVRLLGLKNGFNEIAREEVGHVVEDGVSALLAGAQIGFTREEAMRKLGVDAIPVDAPGPPKPKDPRKAPARFLFEAGTFYAVQAFADAAPVTHGPGLRVALLVGGTKLRVGGELGAQLRFPVSVQSPPLGFDLTTAALRASIAARLETTRWLDVGATVGAGLDVDSLVPRTTGDGASADPAHTFAIGVATTSLGASVHFGNLGAMLSFIADFDPAPTRYTAQQGSQTLVLAQPYAVRAGGMLAFHFRLPGE